MADGSMRVDARPPPDIARPQVAASQPAASPADVAQPSQRIHYLDWLWVLALLGVFLYHAVHPFDTLDWHVKNADQSQLISVVLVFFSAWGLGCSSCWRGQGPSSRCDHARPAATPPNG